MKYAVVAVGLPIDRLFHYSIPSEIGSLVDIGKRVLVPFGKRKIPGYIVGFTNKLPVREAKPIESILETCPSFDEDLLKLTKWLSEYYSCALGEVLKAALPACVRRIRKKPPRGVLATVEEVAERSLPFLPNPEQDRALQLLCESVEAGKGGVFLLHGITGSGKTEIYLQAIACALENKKQAIVLVPEISLTPQTRERVEARFGEKTATLHSQLTDSERYRTWERVRSGEASIVIGPRSAVFAPVKRLGLIIVDEEHENSYKQMESPRYHVREVAIMRAKLTGAPVLLASATPSLESYYNAEKGKYSLLKLTKRIDDRPLPEVDIVDMRGERSPVFSNYLRQELEKTLQRGEQTILFLNRRGYSNAALCRRCGYVVRCKRCSVALTYHASSGKFLCHYCDYEEEAKQICPACQGGYLSRFGVGTQQVERELAKLFPQARVQRMDSDVTATKGSHTRIFKAFKHGEIDVLLGTQMIAKGLDFPEVTLVGVISADTALNFPDFRASEHTFQLLTQVAGRAGRGDIPGKVIVQTHNPDHYAIVYARSHDYEGFYKKEMEFRRQLLYPPFSHLVALTVIGKEEKKVEAGALLIGNIISGFSQVEKVDILGPAPAPISKIRGRYRWQVILKGKKVGGLQRILRLLRREIEERKHIRGARIIVDVDPIAML